MSSLAISSSSRKTPCPICGRIKDGDCRWADRWISCHTGAAANDLRPGDTIAALGRTWYLSRTNAGHSGCAHLYKPDRPKEAARHRQQQLRRPEAIALPVACKRFSAALRPRVHAALRLPLWELCTLADLRLVIDTLEAVQRFRRQLQDACRVDPALARLLPIARHWVEALGHHRSDLARFQRQQLGMQEGWR